MPDPIPPAAPSSRAIALDLAAHGHDVAVTARDVADAQPVAAEIRATGTVLPVDGGISMH